MIVKQYLTATRHAYSSYVVLAGKKFWDALSGDEKKILSQAWPGCSPSCGSRA